MAPENAEQEPVLAEETPAEDQKVEETAEEPATAPKETKETTEAKTEEKESKPATKRSSTRRSNKNAASIVSSVKKASEPPKTESGASTAKKSEASSIVSSVKKASEPPKESGRSSVRGRATSFKKIRGFLRGESRRKNKAKAGEASSESRRAELKDGAGAREDDGSTVYNVTLDDRSVATSNMSASDLPKADEKYLLRMVVLLMDVGTRRFELLQLEFDSEKALVSDVLTQVPVSVTEESLRSQTYVSIVTEDGEEMAPEKPLSGFCKGNDVLVAVPEGISAKEASRLSKPILSDKKVISMLKSSGVETSKTQEAGEPTSDAEAWTSRQLEKGGKDQVKVGGTLVFVAIIVVLAAVVAGFVHKYITTPIQPGHVVSPGIVLSKCGLKFFSGCDRAYLEVQQGQVSYYEGKELAWVIHGHVCPADQLKSKTCMDGLEFKKDRSLWLGGEPIKWLERYSEKGEKSKNLDYLVPWPFTEEPKIKSWEIASSKLANSASNTVGNAKEATGKLVDNTKKIAGDAKNAAGKIAGDAKSAAGNLANNTKTAAGKIAGDAKTAAGKIAGDAKTAAGKIANTTVTTAGKIKDDAADKIKKATDRIKEAPVFSNKMK